ncbi:MAG: hypothetical protein COU08_02890 [Candidatus Harrisonbacteria bacterium CG10_big_fil_rev_8_21_14_0_10_42_17]|uniref:Uncharacterized protein n=1 Tax=Candidatus Harrisonbacteria bacterium CG10_big_fil_rev_8_21_14_0_10_42_17 TaxID=1974584 RepID=A0A2M6WHS9_9BACT|nr:MAG: hypothetical protein COU08_02890 [Candidatus Harrisonbacteria bacterium CG10_big_fil_rev_8_21_14_0_10_42_17]
MASGKQRTITKTSSSRTKKTDPHEHGIWIVSFGIVLILLIAAVAFLYQKNRMLSQEFDYLNQTLRLKLVRLSDQNDQLQQRLENEIAEREVLEEVRVGEHSESVFSE